MVKGVPSVWSRGLALAAQINALDLAGVLNQRSRLAIRKLAKIRVEEAHISGVETSARGQIKCIDKEKQQQTGLRDG